MKRVPFGEPVAIKILPDCAASIFFDSFPVGNGFFLLASAEIEILIVELTAATDQELLQRQKRCQEPFI